MSGYPYNNPQYPQYPPPGYPQQPPQAFMPPQQPPNQLYPQVAGLSYGQNPAAMSYPGMPPPSAPPAATGPMGFAPGVAPTPVYPVYGQPVEWVPSNCASAEMLTQRAVVAGYEGYDGSPLWVIRSHYEGDLIPGKLAVKHKAAYVPWGGKENKVDNFEVCCAQPDRVRWVEARNGVVPPNAIPGGRVSTGETLYIGRAKEQGSLTPGKIHPSHKTLYMSFGGDEIPHPVYEVLCGV
ncbi:unnamed protein product [Diatraea saccharalis]|uniref:Uncharacterized protein n=1 Tax=Diatraea saccharalis TaxID=40085 RepID=A0A9N9R0X0_9NEOP|nr:unnamed protein product [Diatraea saccharalis]